MNKLLTRTAIVALILFLFGFVFSEQHIMPVQGATSKDWNNKSFWYSPWGRSGVHRGIDIFAKQGTPVLASTSGFIFYSGKLSLGGNVVFLLGSKWRVHYFAHLNDTNNHSIGFVDAGEKIGAVGSSGNAVGKPAHLHYSIKSLYPQFWRYNPKMIYAFTRMFYVDPNKFLKS